MDKYEQQQQWGTIVTDEDRRVLRKAQEKTRKLEKSGHRWFQVGNRTKVLIECDEHGNLTERGKRQLEKCQESVL